MIIKLLEQIKSALNSIIKFDLTEINIFEIGHEEIGRKWSWYAVLLLDKKPKCKATKIG
jgi:hypothetical protein